MDLEIKQNLVQHNKMEQNSSFRQILHQLIENENKDTQRKAIEYQVQNSTSFYTNTKNMIEHIDISRIDASIQPIVLYVYWVTIFLSLILNTITIFVLVRSARKRVLKFCLINLSICDMLASTMNTVFLLSDFMDGYWRFERWLCPVARFTHLMGTSASVATLVTIAVDRYQAIVRQSQSQHWMSKKFHLVSVVWSLAIVISIPEAMFFDAIPDEWGIVFCRTTIDPLISDIYTIFIYMITFIGPLGVLTYLGYKIVTSLRTHNVPGNANQNWGPNMEMTRLRVTKGLAVVVISFTITWAPLQTISLAIFLGKPYLIDIQKESLLNKCIIYTYLTTHWLSVSYAVINPLIYCFMSGDFRNDLKQVVCGGTSIGDSCKYVPGHNSIKVTSLSCKSSQATRTSFLKKNHHSFTSQVVELENRVQFHENQCRNNQKHMASEIPIELL